MPRRKQLSPRRFYTQALDEAELVDFQAAAGIEGIDDEITLMRLRIKDLVHVEDIEPLAMAMRTLARLVATRYNVGRHDKKGIKDAIGNVLRDIALPLGIVAGQKFLK